MTKSKVFFTLCLAFISGIAAHSFFSSEARLGESFWWYVGFLGCFFSSIVILSAGRRPESKDLTPPLGQGVRFLAALGMTISFASLGFFSYSQTIPITNAYHLGHYLDQEVAVRGMVDSLPRRREKTTAYVVKLATHDGKLLLTVPSYPPYRFSDELFVKCTPQSLSQYEKWAIREGVSAACAFPEHVAAIPSLRVREGGGGLQTIRTTLYAFRTHFDAHLRALFPNPYGGLLSGILYGDTSGISAPLKAAFRITGLAHITALSGYNITVISWVLVSGLIWIGLTRKQAMPVTLLLIFGFVLATGAEASVVRAAIMGSLASLAQGIGRARHPRNALAAAGVVMLAVNPRLLRFDLGFLLSFAATIALLYFADDIAERTLVRHLPKIWEIRKAGAASVAALIFTTPLLLYHTGILGPFALLVNILVVPIVPAIMALGFLATALDFLWHPLGVGVSFIARAPLQYIISITEYFARFGALHIRLSFLSALILFCATAWVMWRWKREASPAVKSQRHIPKAAGSIFDGRS